VTRPRTGLPGLRSPLPLSPIPDFSNVPGVGVGVGRRVVQNEVTSGKGDDGDAGDGGVDDGVGVDENVTTYRSISKPTRLRSPFDLME